MADVIEGNGETHRRGATAADARLELSISQANAGELVNWEDAETWIKSWGTKCELGRPEPRGVE